MTYHIDAIFDEPYMMQLLTLQDKSLDYQQPSTKPVLIVGNDYITKLKNIYSQALKKQGACFVAGEDFCKQLNLLYSNK